MNEWTSFEALEAYLWRRLEEAADTAEDPWRLVVLATIGETGPQARLVGLRSVDRAMRMLEVHTDMRSVKVSELAKDDRAQLLFWDPSREEQLRVSLHMSVLQGDEARWDRVPMQARQNYGTDPAPAVPIDHPEAYARKPERARFAALSGRVVGMDAVLLRSDPHRRAVLREGEWGWVAP